MLHRYYCYCHYYLKHPWSCLKLYHKHRPPLQAELSSERTSVFVLEKEFTKETKTVKEVQSLLKAQYVSKTNTSKLAAQSVPNRDGLGYFYCGGGGGGQSSGLSGAFSKANYLFVPILDLTRVSSWWVHAPFGQDRF